jgi:cytochrome c oxidase cbb3-type subunit 2
MELFDNHKKLFSTAALFFIVFTILVAIIPPWRNQYNNAPLPNSVPLSTDAAKGKEVFISNGCVACHTQQVRNISMDKVWGERPSIAADYADIHRQSIWVNTATLMGTERTGPDLTNIGLRQPSKDWNLVHLYNPRIVVKESIRPSYSFLFEVKENPDKNDVVINVPEAYLYGKKGKVAAKPEALQLVAYLASLKQTKLPDGSPTPDFLYKQQSLAANNNSQNVSGNTLNGEALYVANCQICHQAYGEGFPGAFPPLKGSKVVLDDNADLMVNIIMNGYTGREKEGFGPMPPVGTNNNVSAEEIAAIMYHEKTSWGNNAKQVSVDKVKKLIDLAKKVASNQ